MAEFDVVTIGAGPAGAYAALAASAAGLRVALFDENPSAGGQIYRARAADRGGGVRGSADERAGDALRRTLAASRVTAFYGHAVWSVSGERYRLDATGPQGAVHCTARALIVACGTTERVVPFDGWTTPGVIGLAAATVMLKAYGLLPGRSTLVAGCGPLLAAVAAKTLEGGGKVDAIADLASSADWAHALPAMTARPDLLLQGFKWWRTLRRAGTPRYARHMIVGVEPQGARLRATLAPCDSAGRPLDGPRKTLLTDCIAVGHGLIPATEITRLLGAEHRYSRIDGGWIAVTDPDGRTSRRLLYAAGDATGVAGAAAASAHGTLVGLACALDLGAPDRVGLQRRIESARAQHRRATRFGRAMAPLMALRAAHADSISATTIVCRCEDVTRADIDAACDAGARDMNQLKAWTRCGMGPCQGRTCGDVAAELLARRTGLDSRVAVGCFSARAPLRPVSVAALTGAFSYDDIPIPQAAPL